LLYSDDTLSFEEKFKNREKLALSFNLPALNSLRIMFESSDCTISTTHSDVFFCATNLPRDVIGSVVQFDGNISETSTTTLKTAHTIGVIVNKILTVTPQGEKFTYQAITNFQLPLEGNDFFYVNTKKDMLSVRKDF
jgi:hypothetical protein